VGHCLGLFDWSVSKHRRPHANPGLHPDVPADELIISGSFLVRYLAGEGEIKPQLLFVVLQ